MMSRTRSHRTLSKSDFKLARTCVTKLYYKELGYPQNLDENPYLALLAEGGYMVEQFARLMFPEGIELTYGRDSVANALATTNALAAENVTLFEATLLSGRKLARVDVLRKIGNQIDLIEVKSKSFDGDDIDEGSAGPFRSKVKPHGILAPWRPYLEDVAFQVHVLRELYPSAMIHPYLLIVDKSQLTTTEGLPGMFDIRRDMVVEGIKKDLDVRFIGDVAEMHPKEILKQIDVSSEVTELLPEVIADADRFVALLGNDAPIKEQASLSWDCHKCEYRMGKDEPKNGLRECWGVLADPDPHIFDIYRLGSNKWGDARLGDVMIRGGKTGLLDVNPDQLVKKDGTATKDSVRQRVQIEHTRANTSWIGEGLAAELGKMQWPLHFIDFETSAIALPYHAGMHPYEMTGFQWSCHNLVGAGAQPTHMEWLNAEDTWPCLQFVQSLRDAVGDEGTVLMWSAHEKTTLNKVQQQMARYGVGDDSLKAWIDGMIGANGRPQRLVDLNRICVNQFFHPDMKGKTSIKVVLDALWKSDPIMRERYTEWTGQPANALVGPYEGLQPIIVNGTELNVKEGIGAMRAYQAMLYGAERHDPKIVATWRELLLQYCKLDSLAMVLIWDHWRRAV